MSVDENRTMAVKFIDLMVQGRVKEMPLADDFSAWSGASGEISGADYVTRTSFIPKAFSGPLKFTFDGTTAEGDRVAVQTRSRGRLINGKDYENNYHFLIVFKNGRIQRVFEYFNVKTAAELLMPVLLAIVADAKRSA